MMFWQTELDLNSETLLLVVKCFHYNSFSRKFEKGR